MLAFLFLLASTVGHPHHARRSPPPPQDCRRFMFASEGQSFQFQFCGGLNSGVANDAFRRKSEICRTDLSFHNCPFYGLSAKAAKVSRSNFSFAAG
jgi:hypothetical protein